MNILITLTSAGSDTGPFNLYSNVDNYTTCFDSNISKAILIAGYTTTLAPTGTTTVRVASLGTCSNYVDIAVVVPTTTTTSTLAPTTTTTTTVAPGTTTTTTTGDPGTTTTTTTGDPGTTTTTTTADPGTTTTTTTEAPGANSWYQLTNCDTSAIDYSGMYTTGTFSLNDRVIDLASNIWNITNVYYTSQGGSELLIGSTGFTGCPGETTTTTTTIELTTTTTTTEPPVTTTTTTEPPTTTTTTTASPLCDQGNVVIIAVDGVYGPYSYTTCSGTVVNQPGGSGTQGQILETGICVQEGTFSNTGATVQLNPTGSCS